MKKIQYFAIAVLLILVSCKKDFLEKQPQGELSTEQLANQDGVEGLLIGAYGLLNGNVSGTWGNYGAAPSMWLFGEVASDNAHKGSNNGDQPNMNAIEQHVPTSTNDNLANLWDRCFEGIIRANNTLKVLAIVQAGSTAKFTPQRATEIEAEARMLRAHYNFFLVRVFKNVPLITETSAAGIPNDKDIYPSIVADLKFAADNLTTTKPKGEVGRVDKLAAQAYLGKVYLYQKNYALAYPTLNSVILAKADLTTMPFNDNFDITKENGPEVIFAVQNAVGGDGAGGVNGNVGDMLNNPYLGSLPQNCCGFFQPSIDLASSYKVTAGGLPFLDASYRLAPYKSDFGLTGTSKTNFTPDQTIALDPRIDYTLGRRGVPYRDWGMMAGDSWIRDPSFGGPFVPIKNTINADQISSGALSGATNITGLNTNLIRLADVYLMAAEAAIEIGDVPRALVLVNKVRERAAKIPGKLINGTPAAAYHVSQYSSFPDPTYARNAVRFERRLELSLEGHRFFDLVRWGIAKQTIESYNNFEGGYLTYLKGLPYTAAADYFPIPQDQIDRSQGVLKQNPGY